jgi:hypothetical protein
MIPRASQFRSVGLLRRGFCRAAILLVCLIPIAPAPAQQAHPARTTPTGGPWQTDQAGFNPDLTYPILYTLTLHGGALLFLTSLDKDTTGFSSPSARNFEEAFTKGPRADDDEWYWNYVLHPLAGSESYLRARAQGCSPFGSFLFSAAASAVWEFGFESWYERPSTQDLIITPVAGSFLGEARFYAKRALIESDTASARLLVVAIDPFQSFAEWVGSAFGQDWSEPAFRQDPIGVSQGDPIFTTSLATFEGRPGVSFNCFFTF